MNSFSDPAAFREPVGGCRLILGRSGGPGRPPCYEVVPRELEVVATLDDLLVLDTRRHGPSGSLALWRFVLFCRGPADAAALHAGLIAPSSSARQVFVERRGPVRGLAVLAPEVVVTSGQVDLPAVRRRFLPATEDLLEATSPGSRPRMFLRVKGGCPTASETSRRRVIVEE